MALGGAGDRAATHGAANAAAPLTCRGTRLRAAEGHAWPGIAVQVWDREGVGEASWRSALHRLSLALTDLGPVEIRDTDGGPLAAGRLGPGALVVQPAGLGIRVHHGAARTVHVLLDPALLHDPALAGPGGCPPEPRFAMGLADPFIAEALRALAREAASGAPGDRLLADAIGAVLAVRLSRLAGGGPPPPGGAFSPERLRRVQAYIEAHLERDLGLAELAGIACLSPTHFSRSFKAATGLGPHRYVMSRRVERAKAMLRPGGPPLACVAVALGFGDQAHFTAAFRRATGTTPGRYRASLG